MPKDTDVLHSTSKPPVQGPVESVNMKKVNQVSNTATNDKDLVELAGYHAYKHHATTDVINVNGTDFSVIHTKYNTESGLDALTVENFDTKELTIVFVGSEQLKEDWLGTNLKLLSDTPPTQLKEAVDYFNEVNRDHGKVSSVTGNSLAGALTNAVAIENPSVKAVTLNPAMLPEGMVNPAKNYSNITNYYSKYDFLTSTQGTIQLESRIPGNKYSINNGLPLFSMFTSNHTGYVKADENGNHTIQIGLEGEPGYGFIHIGAADHIVTSLWTGSPLYGGSAEKIAINHENMTALANGIKEHVKGRMGLATGYLEKSVSIVDDESARFSLRVTVLQEMFKQKLEETAGDPLFIGIAGTGHLIKGCIDSLISLLDKAEERCRFLNTVLNSKPAEIIEYVMSINISVDSLFAPVRSYLQDLKDDVDNLVAGAQNIITKDIPDFFRGGKDHFVDAVVGELTAHYAVIFANKNKMHGQLNEYENQVQSVADAFINKDNSLAGVISTNASTLGDTDSVQKTSVFSLDPSPYLETRMKIKEIQVDFAHANITTVTTMILTPILYAMEFVLSLIEAALAAIVSSIHAVVNVGLYGNPVGLIVSLFSDYDQKVKAAANRALEPIKEMLSTVEGLRNGVGRMIVNLPEMISNFKPYIDTATFEPGKFENVRLYNLAASAIMDEMEILFKDITFQLSHEKGDAIEASLEISESVLHNILLLSEQVDRGTIQ
ncbi:MAG: hypothetical protein ABS920_10855 [Sporosarcina sp.]